MNSEVIASEFFMLHISFHDWQFDLRHRRCIPNEVAAQNTSVFLPYSWLKSCRGTNIQHILEPTDNPQLNTKIQKAKDELSNFTKSLTDKLSNSKE